MTGATSSDRFAGDSIVGKPGGRASWDGVDDEWKDQLKEEIKDVVGNGEIDATMLAGLKKSALEGECGFLATSLYAKSIFGEDTLVNLSIEKQADGKLSGYIKIRSKTQGIALSLGDKITLKQKGTV
ncbi:hypothetical protein Vadar_022604 [Vaccinium darrowii]|uniref:Uncharacterized protein n=1 Tax=Vaccinium darrowii TaxID=229202 RepID=A0ACB7XJM5_9ERIC|nr:hypothetical protein Vadar_022604 [Vaccinium darrowii]